MALRLKIHFEPPERHFSLLKVIFFDIIHM